MNCSSHKNQKGIYTCPNCKQLCCSKECFQTHNNQMCFNLFAEKQIHEIMNQTQSEEEIHQFETLLQRNGKIEIEIQKEKEKEIEMKCQQEKELIEKIEKGEIESIEQLESLLTKEQLMYFNSHMTEICQEYIDSFIPWYLSTSSCERPSEIISKIEIKQASPVLNKCIDICIIIILLYYL